MDVLEFVDDQEVPSSPTSSSVSARRRAIATSNVGQAHGSPLSGHETSVQDSSQNSFSTATSKSSTIASLNPLKGGRTRHARRKARKQEELALQQQEEKNNGSPHNRHVRFSSQTRQERVSSNDTNGNEDDDEKTSEVDSFVASSCSLSTQVNGQPPMATINTHRRRRRKAASLPTDNENATSNKARRLNADYGTKNGSSSVGGATATPDAGSGTKKSVSISEQIKRKLQQHDRQQQRLCPSPAVSVMRKVRRGGDAYAALEAGQFQMLFDQCHYLCSSAMACPMERHLAESGIVAEVSELAELLGSTEKRRTLWKGSDSSSTMDAILSVWNHAAKVLECRMQRKDRWSSLRQRLQSTSWGNHPCMEPPQVPPNIVEEYYAALLLDSLAAIMSFVSWDCTIGNRASAFYKSPRGARVLRNSILHHEGALHAMLFVIQNADPVVTGILEPKCQSTTDMKPCSPESKLAVLESPTKWDHKNSQSQHSDVSSLDPQPSPSKYSQATSVESSQNNETESSASVSTKEDPTAAGRRRRKKHGGRGGQLGPIAEEGLVALSFSEIAATKNDALSQSDSSPRFVFQKHQSWGATCTTEDDRSPSGTTPQRRGWNYRKNTQDRSMTRYNNAILKIHERLSKARARFVMSASTSKEKSPKEHDCQDHRELPPAFGGKDVPGTASSLTVGSLRRLLTGKEEGDEYSCLDHVDGIYNRSSDLEADDDSDDQKETSDHEESDEIHNNPLLKTNRLLGKSGVIPYLAQGIAETLAAAIEELQLQEGKACHACMQHLYDRFHGLAAVVDGACLMHDENRAEFCAATMNEQDSSDRGFLMGSLVLFLKVWLELKQPERKGKTSRMASLLADMVLSALRTLTSLTHDNDLAVEQLGIHYNEVGKNKRAWTGIEVIGRVLHQAVLKEREDNKVLYDTRIFCLNTLANVVGEEPYGDIRRILNGLKLTRDEAKNGSRRSMPFLSWLARWLVSETQSFREAIMKGSFGGSGDPSNSRHSDRELEKHEQEHLVTAGNGCVLLACLLVDPSNGKGGAGMADVTQHVREVILSEMPLDESTGLLSGTLFIQNTLRAFSNFLYYSVGDLSVAVVGPVRKLIDKLDKIKVEVVP